MARRQTIIITFFIAAILFIYSSQVYACGESGSVVVSGSSETSETSESVESVDNSSVDTQASVAENKEAAATEENTAKKEDAAVGSSEKKEDAAINS
ncbi:hypothetical protein NEAUS06_1060 [Nematocida ausubeli]|nr:hypothetical protein NEAUS06_1060 [Nematocida ausubeli]